jgi:tRNA/tmRNA/rRNA uracil-C5-methylase (TrmA/RlmC/RlmD family)
MVSVELDERLVQALRHICQLNGIRLENELGNFEDGGAGLKVVAEDAGKYVSRLQKQQEPGCHHEFDLLLVDPPKQGLDASVCDFALNRTCLGHILYVSCGRDALVRDLERLESCFRVVDCALLDLFPGTGSVETLVHLERRS